MMHDLTVCCGGKEAPIDELVKTTLKGDDLTSVYAEIDKLTFDPDAKRESDGRSLLHAACQQGNVELVRKLLDKRANIEIKTQLDATPLIIAASAGHIGVVKLLLASGADPLAKDSSGNTALEHARFKSFVAIVTELEEAQEKATKAKAAKDQGRSCDGASSSSSESGQGQCVVN